MMYVVLAYLYIHAQVYTSEQSYELAHRFLIPSRGPNPTISAAAFRADKRFSYFLIRIANATLNK